MAFVRVKGPDGSEFTIDERAVKGMGVTVLDKPSTDQNGRPLAPKQHTNKAGIPQASTKQKEA